MNMNTRNISKYFFLIFSFLFLSTLSISAEETDGIDQEPTNVECVEQEPTTTLDPVEQETTLSTQPSDEDVSQETVSQPNETVEETTPIQPTVQSIILHTNEVSQPEESIPVEPKENTLKLIPMVFIAFKIS